MIGVEKLTEIAKEKARLSRDLEYKKLDLKLKQDRLERAIRNGDPVTMKYLSVKYTEQEVARIANKLKRLK